MRKSGDHERSESRTREVRFLQSIMKNEGLTPHAVDLFQKIIYSYYREHGRAFPWRKTCNPYQILVSEFMLQQTQTERVAPKYEQFIDTFPDFCSVASASLTDILKVWRGLGYNRRALNLQRTAKIVVDSYQGVLPSSPDILLTFPGIGQATACAIAAFAYGSPVVFVETNIRTVFIHFFFWEKEDIRDKDILPLVEKTLDCENPREWYYALMDYGVMLKTAHRTLTKKSAHYQKQAPFEGSNRQIRGAILRALLEKSPLAEPELVKTLGIPGEKVKKCLVQLEKEGFLKRKGIKIIME